MLLFAYINDLTENLKYNVKLFSDDTVLAVVAGDSDAAASTGNHDVELTMIITEANSPFRSSYPMAGYH